MSRSYSPQDVRTEAPRFQLPIDWWRLIPFVFLHVTCLAVFLVGVSWIALVVCVATYMLRAFAVSVFYHRGFAHRSFTASRLTQFFFAVLGVAATQRGPIWWAGIHRLHHQYADTDKDPHNSKQGFWHSHMLWFLRNDTLDISLEGFKDLAQFPEIRWLNRNDLIVSVAFAAVIFLLGLALHPIFPGTNGWQMLVWGYFVSTVALMHVTFLVNSLGHRFGNRVFDTGDDSRNLWWLALISMGEGWHNNHHKHARSARLGLYWWQVDLGFYGLSLLRKLKLVHDVRLAPRPSVIQKAV